MTGLTDEDRGTCAGEGADRFFTFALRAPARLFATATGFDSVLYLRRGCRGRDLACNDDAFPPGDGSAHLEVDLPSGDYVLVLDSEGLGQRDALYELSLRFAPVEIPDAGPPPPPRDAGVPDAAEPDVEPDVESDVEPDLAPPPPDADLADRRRFPFLPPDAAPPPPPADATPPPAADARPAPPPDASPPPPPPADDAATAARPSGDLGPRSVDAARDASRPRDVAAPIPGAEDDERGSEFALPRRTGCQAAPGFAPWLFLLVGLRRRRPRPPGR